jgi:hypothetical protein
MQTCGCKIECKVFLCKDLNIPCVNFISISTLDLTSALQFCFSDMEACIVFSRTMVSRGGLVSKASEVPVAVALDSKYVNYVSGPFVRLIQNLLTLSRISGVQRLVYSTDQHDAVPNGAKNQSRRVKVSAGLSGLLIEVLSTVLHLETIPVGCEPTTAILDW